MNVLFYAVFHSFVTEETSPCADPKEYATCMKDIRTEVCGQKAHKPHFMEKYDFYITDLPVRCSICETDSSPSSSR
jgi:hypothetical protein